MSHPTDIVIPVHNALEFTKRCVETVFQHTPLMNRFVFVDDFSDKETTDYLMSVLLQQPSALYIRTGSQRWFSRAANLGLRMARTQRTLLLNSDCIVGPQWLEELHSVWDEAEAQGLKIGLVGSVYAESEQRRWVATQEPSYVTGHALLLNIQAMQHASDARGCSGWYFDERPDHNENIHIRSDVEICYNLNRLGYATIMSFKSGVGHLAGQSWGHDLGKIYGLRGTDVLKGEVIRSF